jgi:uncharacterized membrane protein HdeD (DUF308 family)
MTQRAHAGAVFCGVIVAALVALAPARARASDAGSIDLDSQTVAGTLLVCSAIGFGVADLAFIARDQPTPPWLSLLQIGLSGVFLPMNVFLSDPSVGLTIAAASSAAWFTSFGVYNLAVYPGYRRAKAREAYGFSITSHSRGGMLLVRARL